MLTLHKEFLFAGWVFYKDHSTYHLPLADTQWRLIGSIINLQAPGVRREHYDQIITRTIPFYDPDLFIHLWDKVHVSLNVSANLCIRVCVCGSGVQSFFVWSNTFSKKLNKRTNVHLIYNNDDGGDENDDELSSSFTKHFVLFLPSREQWTLTVRCGTATYCKWACTFTSFHFFVVIGIHCFLCVFFWDNFHVQNQGDTFFWVNHYNIIGTAKKLH